MEKTIKSREKRARDTMRRQLAVFLTLSLLMSVGYWVDSCSGGPSNLKITTSSPLSSTIIVAQDGTGDHTNIQSAIETANTGDIIRVYDGIFYSSVNVHKKVTLIGNGTTTIMDGNNTIDHQDLFRISADGVNITGFQIREGSPHHELAGIGLYAAYCNISGNLFKNTNNNAMYIAGGPGNIIANNTFINNGYCIRSDSNADGNLIKDNIFNGSIVGAIIYQRASGVRILDNQFNNNEYHFADFTTRGFEIGGNDFHGSNVQRYGLMVAGSIDNIYHNNSFKDNGPAIGFINGVDRININDNVFMENIHGLNFRDTSTNIHVHRNDFINNSVWGINASGSSVSINATDNFWGNYTGPFHPALNPSGTGDNVSDNVTFVPWLRGKYVNRAPLLEMIGPLMVLEDDTFNLKLNISDPDNDLLNIKLITDADFLEFNSTSHEVSGIPDNLDVGQYSLRINVTDGMGGSAEEETIITVMNTPPLILTQNLPDAIEDDFYNIDILFKVEPGSDWEFNTNGNWLEFNEEFVSISGYPVNDDVGVYWIYLNQSDGNGMFSVVNLTLFVVNVDDPPYLNIPLENLQFNEDTSIELDLSGWVMDADDDIDEYVFNGEGNISVEFNVDSRKAVLTPASNWSGFEIGNFTARVGRSMVFQTIFIDVLPVNDAPRILEMNISDPEIFENEEFYLNGTGTDPDLEYGDRLELCWTSNISGILGKGVSLQLDLPAGHHLISLNVSDSSGEFDVLSQSLIVMEKIVEPPVIDDNTTVPDDNTTDDDNTTIPDNPVDDNTTIPDGDDDLPGNSTDPVDDDTDEISPEDMLFFSFLIAGVIILIIAISLFAIMRGRREEDLDWDYEE